MQNNLKVFWQKETNNSTLDTQKETMAKKEDGLRSTPHLIVAIQLK